MVRRRHKHKPGLKTTEFWLALLVTASGIAATVWSSKPWAQALGMFSSALTAAGYAFARAHVKKQSP